mmetsp:Transcript_9906/g.28732  ORF Transcript_9906/g.28732 Transcript_9906/m.28732 type:complete len:364 (-) Transcript_9906:368-1459(-)
MHIRPAQELGLLLIEVRLQVMAEAVGLRNCLDRIHILRLPMQLRRRALQEMQDAVEQRPAKLALEQGLEVVVGLILVLVDVVVAPLEVHHLAVVQATQHAADALLVGAEPLACLIDPVGEEVHAWAASCEHRKLEITRHFLLDILDQSPLAVFELVIRCNDRHASRLPGLAENVEEDLLFCACPLPGAGIVQLLRQVRGIIWDRAALITVELDKRVNPLTVPLFPPPSCLRLDALHHVLVLKILGIEGRGRLQLVVCPCGEHLDQDEVCATPTADCAPDEQSVPLRVAHRAIGEEAPEVREGVATEHAEDGLVLTTNEVLERAPVPLLIDLVRKDDVLAKSAQDDLAHLLLIRSYTVAGLSQV